MNTTTSYRTTTIRVGNCIVNIHQPILTEQERNKQAEKVVSALKLYGRTILNNKERER